MKLLLFLLLIQTAVAQTFVTEKSFTSLKFEGSFLTEGRSEKGVITVRESQGSQKVLIVNEVVDFRFPTQFEETEFNEEFMESQYFPQIRISGSLKEKVDLTEDGVYLVNFKGTFTMRYQTVDMEVPVRIEISGTSMTFNFRSKLDLVKFYVPYAGPGSEVGEFADYHFTATLKRTH